MTSSGNERVDQVARLVLDTSAYSQLRHGHDTVLDAVAAAGAVLLTVTVLGELEAGFELGTRAKENRTALTEFLDEPFVALLTTTPSVAYRYGQIFAELRRAGSPIPVNDIWIAAATLDCGGHLLTFDEDYRQVKSLELTLLRP
jgi:predicted nucleic acid-binding protein